jgi:hypothetical protein
MAEAGLRREIHNALDAIDRSAPHLPHIVARAVHEHAQDRRRPQRRRALAAVAVLLLGTLTALTLIRLSHEQTQPRVPATSPTQRLETTPWAENLTFGGAINAEIRATLTDDGGVIVNTCGDSVSRRAGDFNVTLYLPSDDGSPMLFMLQALHYHGPGAYTGTAVRVVISHLNGFDSWVSVAENQVTLTVNADEKSGAIDAHLSPFNPSAAPVTVTGSWSCHTSP